MQAAVRTRYNHALEYAIHLANHRRVALEVFFVLTPDYPGATERHYRFLLEGLQDVAKGLEARRIPFSLHQGDPASVCLRLAAHASTIVTDRGYTRIQRKWRDQLKLDASCSIVEVDTNAVVPVETASDKEQYSAATIRPRIHRHRDTFLQPVKPVEYWNASLYRGGVTRGAGSTPWPKAPGSPAKPGAFSGGETEAARTLDEFVSFRLRDYHQLRNVPDRDWTSRMSPYLHFGQISPVEIALRALEAADAEPEITQSVETLLEELIVRRELAINFVWYNQRYDTYDALPEWARKSLAEHAADDRPALYTARQLENGETHDPYWNACQAQMVETGMMHGYMRMYWGKKIIEWTQDPENAFRIALEMNDRYELDGRDPNGYAGVAWCFGKHDRPWVERPVFGKIRYMNDNGLKRKFREINQYVDRWCS